MEDMDMQGVIGALILSSSLATQVPETSLVTVELPKSGPELGKRLRGSFGAKHVCGKRINPTGTLR